MKPILKSATSGLSTVSGEVIDNVDQYEVFNDPRAVSYLRAISQYHFKPEFLSLTQLILS